jgi:hypothetical protein
LDKDAFRDTKDLHHFQQTISYLSGNTAGNGDPARHQHSDLFSISCRRHCRAYYKHLSLRVCRRTYQA